MLNVSAPHWHESTHPQVLLDLYRSLVHERGTIRTGPGQHWGNAVARRLDANVSRCVQMLQLWPTWTALQKMAVLYLVEGLPLFQHTTPHLYQPVPDVRRGTTPYDAALDSLLPTGLVDAPLGYWSLRCWGIN